MTYQTIKEVRNDFINGKMKFADTITIGNTTYTKTTATKYSLEEMVSSRKTGMVVYGSSSNDHLVFAWRGVGSSIQPVDVKLVSVSGTISEEAQEIKLNSDRILGHKTNIILHGFNNNKPVPAKVDTGAEFCSLDANNVQINPKAGTVSFEFGDRRVTMPMIAHQAVQSSDGGVENRPVVMFDVAVPSADGEKHKLLKKVKFNLNDRSDMPDKILLGQNFIKAGDFAVMNKSSTGKVIESELFSDLEKVFEGSMVGSGADPIDQVIALLTDHDVTMKDLMVRIKTKVVQE